MKNFFKQATMFILILLIPLMCIEYDLSSLRSQQWFNGHANALRESRADCVFLGSSLVAAAVREEQFAKLISVEGQPPRRAINLGRGYTTPVEYLFGLQRMVEINPDVLKGSTIFFPASGGIADSTYWSQDWMNWRQPALLADYIDYPNLVKYCAKPNIPFSEKLLLIASKHLALVAQAKLFAIASMHEVDLLAEWIVNGGKFVKHGVSVVMEGGIRTDEESVAYMRKYHINKAKEDLLNQKPIDWGKTVMADIVTYVEKHGGKVNFMYIPLSTVLMKPLSTPVRQADIKNFDAIVKKWGCRYIHPDFHSHSDDDFPDITHLSEAKSKEYTEALAKAYLSK